MQKTNKVIITCAVTGSVHTPTMSSALPVTPDDIAQQSIDAVEAGAAILHLHARHPNDGRPCFDPDMFMAFLPHIKESTNAVINITTGGGLGMSLDERLAAAERAQPEACSLNMGSMNFGIFQAADKITHWKYEWEKPFLENTYQSIYSNTFQQIEHIIKRIGDRYGTRFEFECYDIGHLYTLEYFANRGLIEPPFFIQGIFGVLGGMGADLENLHYMRAVADRLFGDDYLFSVLAAGRHQMNFVTQNALMGGCCRVGLEDSLYLGKGVLAKNNAEQVLKVRRILEELSLEIASPDEARQMLKLKGADGVAF